MKFQFKSAGANYMRVPEFKNYEFINNDVFEAFYIFEYSSIQQLVRSFWGLRSGMYHHDIFNNNSDLLVSWSL